MSELEEVMRMNQRLLLLLGYATVLIYEQSPKTKKNNKKQDWLMQAITDVVYLNKPLPPFPDEPRS